MSTGTSRPSVGDSGDGRDERFASYVAAWKRRARRRDEEERRRGAEALEEARRAGKILAERYGVARVIVFGSVAWKGRFRSTSDLDLAVEGLAPERFFRADAELAREIRFPVDLKVLSDCPPSLRERIAQEGIVVHEG